ncbi:CPBP family intramembrane glutamic endopeptidase, partial [Nonomuraea cypriaca]|uniref:CPBP family intramembrane glutamic endopeptidase n=1 Tax=Nonomuraea cypriaca TaxID=1187855 RepID=UPI001F192D63
MVLYAMVRKRRGTVAATAISSALFGLWHILPAIDMARANLALGALTGGRPIWTPRGSWRAASCPQRR